VLLVSTTTAVRQRRSHAENEAFEGSSQVDAKVEENVLHHRFELPIADEAVATAYYRLEDGRVVLIHTEVPAEFSGQGFASRLAQGTFELLRQTGRKAVLKCPFMSRYLIKHPEYSDIVAG
jgi:predicted GNAT family acetyltransferase